MSNGNNIHVEQAFTDAAQELYESSEGKSFLHNTNRTVFITVSGRGDFPFDQLRRWASWPSHTGAAAALVTPTYRETDNRDVELTLAGDQLGCTDILQCAARYASFGWTISGCSIALW